jgi:leucyl aminopeptidase (aminopeptidase T)
MSTQKMDPVEAAVNALVVTKDATIGEKIIIFCDKEKEKLGKMFADASIKLGLWTRLYLMNPRKEMRENLEDPIKEVLTSTNPDLIVNIFRGNDEETSYRIKFMRLERRKATRILHCPGITFDMFTEGAASLTVKEYKDMFAYGEKLKESLKGTFKVHVTCPKGSDFTLNLGGKDFQVEKGTNIPTGEINVMPPIGDSFEGKLVSISGGTGKLYRETPAEIYSNNGLAGEVKCVSDHVRNNILIELDRDPGARYLGEFAIGINPNARIVDSFIEAEKAIGTIHVAFGGSYKPSETHLDLLIENPTVTTFKEDGTQFQIMKNGKILI